MRLPWSKYANGLIILPDNWSCPDDVTFNSGFESTSNIDAYATHNTYTLVEWHKLESAGAVFLPASGYRYETSVSLLQNYGRYWFSTAYDSREEYARYFGFGSNGEDTRYYGYRYKGQAVRLVQDVE